MERISKFPCTNCKIATGAEVISKEIFSINKSITVTKIKADCCGITFEEHYTKFNLHHFGIKEIEEKVVLLNN